MKRFWLILLSLGLIMAFNASAFAVDVKFSGSYFAAGAYVDKLNVVKNQTHSDQSTALYFQKLQLTTEFVAAPGLSLVTRANIMERAWGATRSGAGTTLDTGSSATRAENENIGFDYAYINYNSPIGIWMIGYQNDHFFGTTFGDSSTPEGKITYILPLGNFKILAAIVKVSENSYSAVNTASTQTDADFNEYGVAGIYTGKNWEAGLLYLYYDNKSTRTTDNYKNKFQTLQPYAKAKFGPVAVQAEINYYFGKNEYEAPGSADKDISSFNAFFDVLGTFGPFYIGATFAYVQGDDDANDNKVHSVANGGGGRDWKPALILWNEDYTYWIDASAAATNKGNEMTNGYLYQMRGGVKPTDKLDIGVAVTFARQDTSTFQTSKDIGWEIDVTGTYKITDNLSYMLGVGYLIPGDSYKGANSSNELDNTYMVLNKLTLTF
ncbi:MAG: hypothetical protein ABFD75_06455 [Smithella sp.]